MKHLQINFRILFKRITGIILLFTSPYMTAMLWNSDNKNVAMFTPILLIFTIIMYMNIFKDFTISEIKNEKMYKLIEGVNMEKNKDEKVALPTVGTIDLPKLDIEQYIGKKVKIDRADVYKSNKFGGHYVKIETKIVDTLGKGDKKIELRGSRIFGLQEDENGVVGFGKDTKLGVFMAKMKAKQLIELIGKEVILQSQTNENGTDFITFN